MARLNLTLLGGFSARLEPGEPITLPTRKAQALLAYLALSLGHAQPRDKLAALLWGDMAEAQARGSVRTALFALRKALGRSQALVLEGHDVALNPAAVAVDVQAFEQHIARGTPEALAEAARLYAGDLLAGLSLREPPFEEWLILERERLRELAMQGLARLLGHHRAAGELGAAIQAALTLLALDPLQEPVHRTLMRLYTQTGRRAAALRQYQLCVSALERELRAEPEAETKALYQEILRRRAAPSSAEAGVTAPVSSSAAGEGEAGIASEAPLAGRAAPVSEMPLVGRHAELARLSGELEAVWTGRGRIVALIGEAGIGKSRLAMELVALADQRGGRVLIGHCYESEQGLPFAPWVDALRAAGVAGDAGLLDSLGPVWRAELARLLPELRASDPPTGPGEALNLFDAIVQLLERLAARQPVMVVLEDVHWADEMSLRLIGFLGRRIAGARTLVVTTLRNDETSNASLRSVLGDELVRERLLLRLTLSPLSRAETTALVHQLRAPGGARDGDTALEDNVWRVSEGNPFMAVETVRALADDAMVKPQGLSLPAGVRHLVTSRLDRLSERGRRLVSVAAVIGRQFDFALLSRAAELSEDEAAEGVEELVRWRILHQAGDGFAFTHDRIREVAYDELLRPRRVLLHRRIAEAIEATAGTNVDTHALAIGTHYREGQVWPGAALYLTQAGTQASLRYAHRDAAVCYEQALAAAAHLPETRETREQDADLRLRLAHSLYLTGQFARAMAHVRQAEDLGLALGDHRRLGEVYASMAFLLGSEGDLAAATQAGRRAFTIASSLGHPDLQVWTSIGLGRIYYARGDLRQAIECMRLVAGVRPADALEDVPSGERFGRGSLMPSVASRAWLALCLAGTGDFAEALAWGGEGVRMAEALGGPHEQIWASYCLSRVHLARGDAEQAIPLLEKAMPSREGPIPLYGPRVVAGLGRALTMSGRLDAALLLLDRAVAEEQAIALLFGHAMTLIWAAAGRLEAGHLADADRYASAALDLSRRQGGRGDEAWSLHVIGHIAAQKDPPEYERALERFVEALALAEELGMAPLQARCHLGLGAACQRAGRQTDARDHVLRAVEQFRVMEMGVWLSRAEALLASLG